MAASSQEQAPVPARGPAYRIETARLCIRCWDPRDAAALKQAIDANLEYLRPWLPWARDMIEPVETRLAFIRSSRAKLDLDQEFVYGVFDPAETEVMGGTGLHARQGKHGLEIGYWIQERYTGKGYATEAASALTKAAFELHQVKRVHICCAVANARSARIPEKLGFKKEGVLRKWVTNPEGQLDDMMLWTMIDDEYARSIPREMPLFAFDAMGRKILG